MVKVSKQSVFDFFEAEKFQKFKENLSVKIFVEKLNYLLKKLK
jgi:hypothetical protein